ncbi:unnamed protein product, partial [Rotaria magnacalcarata]
MVWGDSQFKYWVQKYFMLIKVGDLNVVYSTDKISRPVEVYEELYTKLDACHNRVGHHGRDKAWHEIKDHYSWVPYDVVMIFIKLCDSCSNRQIFPKFPASKPIVSIGYLTRIQIDLIDMRCRPDVIINGRARHPQTQGLVERGNRTLEVALGKWMQHNKTDEWSKGLRPVVYSINTSVAEATNKTPYKVVFGQSPRSDFEMWKIISESGISDEENLPGDFIDIFDE